MKNDMEVIQLSIYCDIVMTILKKHKNLSINKILVFSYLLKKNKFYAKAVYDGRSSKELVTKALSLLNGLCDDYLNNLLYIFQAVDILIEAQKIELNENILCLKEERYITTYSESLFWERVIEDSSKYTDRQFLKEILNNV